MTTFKLTLWLALLPIATIACYKAGLNGPFLFDDFANLPALAEFGGVNDWQSFRLFCLNGIAGPTGRPLSLLSFLIDDNTWPSDPYRFKYTNLMLHLLNGMLLVWLVYRINRWRRCDEHTAGVVAFLVSVFWLLHPLNVSTVLYVVQRMAILSTTFVVAGLILFVHGRSLLSEQPLRGFILVGTALGLSTVLAVLSKENGIIFPALALVFEFTLFRNSQPPKKWMRYLIVALLCLPTAMIVGYLIQVGLKEGSYSGRAFTVGQRLLTEPRVLFDYLLHWAVPFLPTRGLFVENYPISTDLLTPLSTLPAALGLMLLGVSTLIWRERAPFIALAIGFFLVGHMIESTTIPLEIYFEHRNYLPAMLLVLPLVDYAVVRLKNRSLMTAFCALLIIGMAFSTHRLATLWGNEGLLMLKWAEQNPTSSRAQETLASVLERQGQADAALTILANAVERQPADAHLSLHYLMQACQMDKLSDSVFNGLLGRLHATHYSLHEYTLLEGMVEQLPNAQCQSLGFPRMHALLDAFAEGLHERETAAVRQITHLHGVLYARQHQGDSALAFFLKSQQTLPHLSGGLLQVSILASNGFYKNALVLLAQLEHLPEATQMRAVNRYANLDYPEEIARLRKTIEDDLSHQTQQ